MYLNYSVFLLFLGSSFTEAFFLFTEKNEPVLFCIKICPLYCSPRRRDEDVSSIMYWDEPPFLPREYDSWDFSSPYHDPYYFCKPPAKKPKPTTTTTTTMATTTPEPTWICMVCNKKCK